MKPIKSIEDKGIKVEKVRIDYSALSGHEDVFLNAIQDQLRERKCQGLSSTYIVMSHYVYYALVELFSQKSGFSPEFEDVTRKTLFGLEIIVLEKPKFEIYGLDLQFNWVIG
jgi:hypothetical protein